MAVTVFLVVLIVALFLGNLFLSFTKPASKNPKNLKVNTAAVSNAPETALTANSAYQHQNDFSATVLLLQSQMKGTAERLNVVNKRMDNFERLLLKTNGKDFVIKKLNNLKLVKKLNNLSEFKSDARIQIEALKQRLEKIEKESNIETKSALKQSSEDEKEFNKKLHSIIYRSKKD